MNFVRPSRLPKLRALAALVTVIAGACTYDFDQFEGLGPPLLDDAGQSGRAGAAGAGKDASADGIAGRAGSSGTAGSGQSGSGGGGATGGSGGATGGSGGAMGGTGGSDASGGAAGSSGKSGAAGSGGSAASSGTGGTAPDAGTDGVGGSAGSGGSSGSSGGTTGGSAGTSGGNAGSGGTSIADASDVNRPLDAQPDNRVVDAGPDAFDCAAVNGTPYQGHCYYARSVAVDWNAANTTTCTAPAHLVTITTAGEQAVVAALLPNQDRWIGLRRPANSPQAESSFYWVTNEPLSYRSWEVYSDADKEPNYTGECVRMRFTSMWADALCTDALAVICESE